MTILSEISRKTRDLSISSKLNIGLGMLIALMLLVVGLNALGTNSATANIEHMQDSRVPTALESAQAQVDLLKVLSDIRSYLVLGEDEYRTAYQIDRQDFEGRLNQMAVLSANWTDPQNKDRLGELQATFREWSQWPDEIFALHDDVLQNQPAQRILVTQIHPMFVIIYDDLDAMMAEQARREATLENILLLQNMATLQHTFVKAESALRGYAATTNTVFKFEYLESLIGNQDAWNTLKAKRPRLSEIQISLLDNVEQTREPMSTYAQHMFQALEGEHTYEDLYLLRTEATPLAEDMQEILEAMVNSQQDLLRDEVNQGSRRLNDARWQTLLAGAAVLVVGFALGLVFRRSVSRPILRLTEVAERIITGDLQARAPVESNDEIGRLAQTFNDMTDQLRSTLQNLEERTRVIERRSRYLEASTNVAQAAASILDTDQLIRDVVDLILDRFQLYYVGLFLVDALGEWAVLRAGTGDAGLAMMARGHRIKVGEGMIGWSVANAQPRVALHAEEDAVRQVTPELPDTRSEAAIPLRSRERVLGALTVQHTIPDAFGPAALASLQTMADQVAVAIDNARLLAASQAALEAERRAYGEASRGAWQQLTHERQTQGYYYSQSGLVPILSSTGPLAEQRAPQSSELPALALPIKVRENVVGAINAHKPSEAGEWTAEEIALLEMITGQLSQAMESAQLHQDTQERAAREQLVGQVSSKMRESLDIDTVLQTAVREMRQALGLAQVQVRIKSGLASGTDIDSA
jgi:GAF domain-containing protein